MNDDPELALALSYARADRTDPLRALFALDDTLARIVRRAGDPMIGQMRLTWWHGALTALDAAPPPAEPVLQALAQRVLPLGVTGAQLAELIDGWEVLLDPDPLDAAALRLYADARGGSLFALAGQIVGADAADPLRAAGQGWALVDLSRHADAAASVALARPLLDAACTPRWSRASRPLGALAHLARMTLAVPLDQPVPAGSPRRVARAAWHRLTGR